MRLLELCAPGIVVEEKWPGIWRFSTLCGIPGCLIGSVPLIKC